MCIGAGEVQAGLVTVNPAGSSGATETSGTNWKPMLAARASAGRAMVTVESVMMDASKRGLIVLAGENDVLDKTNLRDRLIRYYTNKVFGIQLTQLDLFALSGFEVGHADTDEPHLSSVLLELAKE